jgi:hypothetical protein
MCRVRVSVSESTYGEKERVRRVLQLATTWWEEKEESPCTCVAAFMARLAMRQREEQGEGGKELAIATKARIQFSAVALIDLDFLAFPFLKRAPPGPRPAGRHGRQTPSLFARRSAETVCSLSCKVTIFF